MPVLTTGAERLAGMPLTVMHFENAVKQATSHESRKTTVMPDVSPTIPISPRDESAVYDM